MEKVDKVSPVDAVELPRQLLLQIPDFRIIFKSASAGFVPGFQVQDDSVRPPALFKVESSAIRQH